MVTNHSSMMGPKIRPMLAVPRAWAANKASRITSASGTT